MPQMPLHLMNESQIATNSTRDLSPDKTPMSLVPLPNVMPHHQALPPQAPAFTFSLCCDVQNRYLISQRILDGAIGIKTQL